MKRVFTTLVLCLVFTSLFAKDGPRQLGQFFITPDVVTLQPEGDIESYTLTITGPNGLVFSEVFTGLHVASFEPVDQNGELLADGSYSIEMVATPRLDAGVREVLKEARMNGDYSAVNDLRSQGLLPQANSMSLSGHVTILNGFFMTQAEVEPRANLTGSIQPRDGRPEDAKPGNPTYEKPSDTFDQVSRHDDPARDFVIADDLIVDGSACIGFDCVNGESFGFDTIRLKENNLRIKFEDTSINAFPSNDWQLTANASANGGAEKFSIDDITNSRTPFTVEARAPSHSLYVDDGGRIGIRTSTPVADVHIVDGDSPVLRLEQNGSSGFAPQTWDIAGNETNFFIRDVSNGSTLPFRIRPGASGDRIFIDTNDDIGFGTAGPDARFHHILGDEGAMLLEQTDSNSAADNDAWLQLRGDDARLVIEDTGGASAIPFTIKNAGTVNFQLIDTNSGNNWSNGVNANVYFLSKSGTGEKEFEVDASGNVTTSGTVNGVSDKNKKENFDSLDPMFVLEQVVKMPLSTWNYIADSDKIRHYGPMAQDFYSAFGLGRGEEYISFTDGIGANMGAIQGLFQIIEQKNKQIEEMEARLRELEDKVFN